MSVPSITGNLPPPTVGKMAACFPHPRRDVIPEPFCDEIFCPIKHCVSVSELFLLSCGSASIGLTGLQVQPNSGFEKVLFPLQAVYLVIEWEEKIWLA